MRRSWGGLGASWGGRAVLTRLDAVLGYHMGPRHAHESGRLGASWGSLEASWGGLGAS